MILPVGNTVDEVEDFTSTDFVNANGPPRRFNVALDYAPCLGFCSLVALIAPQPLIGYSSKIHGGLFPFAGLCRVSPHRYILTCLPPRIACFCQREGRVSAKRHPAKTSTNTKEKNPRLCAAIADAQRKSGEALIEVVTLPLRGRLDPLDGGCGQSLFWQVSRPKVTPGNEKRVLLRYLG